MTPKRHARRSRDSGDIEVADALVFPRTVEDVIDGGVRHKVGNVHSKMKMEG
jgi:hypothetical protein